MSLASQISDLATRIGTEFKTVRTEQSTAISSANTANRARANHTGTQTASTISDFNTAAVSANTTAVNAVKARSTHTGTQSADTIVDGTTNKAFTTILKDKLDAIAAGATVNQTDAYLRARANHTGTQTAATISDFNTAAVSATASAIDAKVGVLSTLTTTAKGTAVAAINELNASIASASGIDDEVVAPASTWSSTKINSSINSAVTGLINGAPATYDTLKEIADYIASDITGMGTITTALTKRLRFDDAQTLTAPEKAQGIANLGAIAASAIGDPETDFAATFVAALA